MVDILLAEHRVTVHPSTAFNLGSFTGFSNLQIVEAARKLTGHPIPLEIFDNIETNIQTAWAWHFSHPDGYNNR